MCGVSVLILGQDSCCFLIFVPGGLAGQHLRLFLPLLPPFCRKAGLTGVCSSPLDSAWALGIHTHILMLVQQVILPRVIPLALVWILHCFVGKSGLTEVVGRFARALHLRVCGEAQG